jgi:Ion transport protein
VKRVGTQASGFKLPGADDKNKKMDAMGREMREDLEKSETAANRINNFKKYNYTKNSLNCIPLSNKFRQWFIRFVEWKHQSNLVLVFVAINSIILGIVDYRFKGKYTDKDAPIGNYLLGITEPIFAVLFTLEALVKIIAQGFVLSKKTYLRD